MSDLVPGKYILYADDDPDDQDFIREVLASANPDIQLITRDSGEEILEYLDALSKVARWPGLIILDLNMPGWNGIETLIMIRQNERYHHLPVLIFSTAANENDRQRAFSEGAVAFIKKPSSFVELKTVIESFKSYLTDN